MKKILLFMGLAGVILILAFLPLAQMEGSRKKADLRMCWGPEPKTLDCGMATGTVEIQYITSLFEGLVTFDGKDPLKPIPGMARSWKISKDQKIYTFFLRKDARWTNGDPVTAHDFYYSWKRLLDLKVDCEYLTMLYYIKNAEEYADTQLAALALKKLNQAIPIEEKIALVEGPLTKGGRKNLVPLIQIYLSKIKSIPLKKMLYKALGRVRTRPTISFREVGIRVIDDRTLEVTLENQTPYILEIFGFATLFPVPKKTVEMHSYYWTKPQNIVCNGPYTIESWKPHYRITLKKNPLYYNHDKVRLNRIDCLIIEQPGTAINYYERGELDFLDKTVIPADFVESLRKRKDFVLNPTIGTTLLRFNVSMPPFNDVRVRKAFAMAVDKEEIVKVLRTGEKATGVLIPPLGDYQKYQPRGISYNPKEARRLLKQAYPDMSKFPRVVFLSSTGGAKIRDLFMVIRSRLKENLGVEIEPKFQEWQVYLESLSRREYQLCYGNWIGDYADPNTFIDMWMSTSGNNRTGWESEEYDQWVRKAASLTDPKERFALLGRCEKRILEEDCIILPLYIRTSYLMIKPQVRGWVPNVMQRYLLQYFWVEKK